MPTFAGRYIQEPGDLSTVASEAKIILAFCDGRQVSAKTFDALSVEDRAVVLNVGNALILAAESMFESSARIRGYAIPLSPIDPVVVSTIAQLVWISALQRGGTLTIVDAGKERDAIRDGILKDIADGNILLTAAMKQDDVAPGSNVFSISDASTRSDGSIRRMSRAELIRY